MHKPIILAVLLAALAIGGCQSSEPATESPTASPSTFDRDEAKQQMWEEARDDFTPQLKMEICDAAQQGDAKGVEDYLRSDEMPFVIDDPAYDAKQWVIYCGT